MFGRMRPKRLSFRQEPERQCQRFSATFSSFASRLHRTKCRTINFILHRPERPIRDSDKTGALFQVERPRADAAEDGDLVPVSSTPRSRSRPFANAMAGDWVCFTKSIWIRLRREAIELGLQIG